MKKIILHTNSLNERGTSVAVYDYAFYLRKYLNFNPIIVYNLNFKNVEQSVNHFKEEFEVIGYESFDDIENFISKKDIEYFYAIKYGNKDGIESKNCKNLIHSVFCSDIDQVHGNRYAVISKWMSEKTNYKIPFVPHMINLPSNDQNYKTQLNIPDDATVIGRYGGKETFNIEFAVQSVQEILEKRTDIWFLFVNTDITINHKRCLQFNAIINLDHKAQFINTCDAFLHARDYGETFGNSVLEFACKNKQIITYDNFELQTTHPLGGRNHFLYLKDNCFKYSNKFELDQILSNINKTNPFDTEYLNIDFSPENVIKQFNEIFIQ